MSNDLFCFNNTVLIARKIAASKWQPSGGRSGARLHSDFLCLHILILSFPSDLLLSSTFFWRRISACFCPTRTRPNLSSTIYFTSKTQRRIGRANPFSRGRRGGRRSSAGHVRGSCIFRVPPRHRAAPPVPSPRPRWRGCSASHEHGPSYLAAAHEAVFQSENWCLFFFFSFLSFGFVSLNKNLLFLLQPLLSPTPPSPWQHILFPRNWFWRRQTACDVSSRNDCLVEEWMGVCYSLGGFMSRS